MSKIQLFLSREDLTERKKSSPINEIGLYDFKSSTVSLKQIEEASLIVFCEKLYDGKGTHGNCHKVLKDRDGNYISGLTNELMPKI